MDRETELLSSLAANHLHLAQFEPLRAILTSLRAKNPDLALAILQTIVSNSGRFGNVLWSQSCPNPSLLTFLSTVELLQFNNSTSHTWSFDPGTLRLRVEFFLFVQLLIDRVTESLRKNVDLDKFEKEKEVIGDFDVREEEKGYFGDFDGLKEGSSELGVLDKVLEFAVRRLKGNVGVEGSEAGSGVLVFEEEELMCLRKVILEDADVFDAMCRNVERQMKGAEVVNESSSLAITVRREENGSVEEAKEGVEVLSLIRKCVQLVHLDAIKECLDEGNEEGVFKHIRFLQLDCGVEETKYR